MALIGTVPRRCVNLPAGALRALVGATLRGRLQEGPEVERFQAEFARWLGVPHVFGAATGRSAFQLALEALDLSAGAEIVFPAFTFPVMPAVAELLGYVPVFCPVDPDTFNAGPEHVEPKITGRTGAVLATHLFGRPCPIEPLAELARGRGIRVLEDCAHACGLRVDGKQVGTFGDVGVFSFAQGKNMPCFGGGAIAVKDDEVAERARRILAEAPIDSASAIRKEATSIWIKWLVTRPLVFGLTAYQALRVKQMLGKPLMDSAVGDDLLERFKKSDPRTRRFANLQAAVGLLQLREIDEFNAGAKRNGEILTRALAGVPGVHVPPPTRDHIFVYYPLRVDPDKRDDLRAHLLRHGVDTKLTDMSDCSTLAAFAGRGAARADGEPVAEATLLEICVYPTLSERQMHRIARAIREWAGLDASPTRAANAAT